MLLVSKETLEYFKEREQKIEENKAKDKAARLRELELAVLEAAEEVESYVIPPIEDIGTGLHDALFDLESAVRAYKDDKEGE